MSADNDSAAQLVRQGEQARGFYFCALYFR